MLETSVQVMLVKNPELFICTVKLFQLAKFVFTDITYEAKGGIISDNPSFSCRFQCLLGLNKKFTCLFTVKLKLPSKINLALPNGFYYVLIFKNFLNICCTLMLYYKYILFINLNYGKSTPIFYM